MMMRVLRRLIPKHYAGEMACLKILSKDYGHLQSMKKQECIDALGNPIPWYTYPSIEYLRQFDFRHCHVFEYGSGNSSLFWSDRVSSILSVEDNEEWYNIVNNKIQPNQNVLYRKKKDDYVNAIHEGDSQFDIVVVDGNHRPECARQLSSRVKKDGLVILDNSDWFKKTAQYIREELDFIQVDFHGFGPINEYTWTTSVFISRSVHLKMLNKIEPAFSTGGLEYFLPADADY